MNKEQSSTVLEGDVFDKIKEIRRNIQLTFFDPPYRQGKEYRFFDDNQSHQKYWKWITKILKVVFRITEENGCIYFMQREKNAEEVLSSLRKSGWTFQNLIIWKKVTSAVPSSLRYGKNYQIIAFATKGKRPRVFNKLRIDYPLKPYHKYARKNGIFVTDVWDDIRELTSGYFAGDEAIRDEEGNRFHKQQTPIALLLRIILSSTKISDTVLDPLAGTGTTLVVAKQLKRNYFGIEIDPDSIKVIKKRLEGIRSSDNILQYRNYYRFTPNLGEIWHMVDSKNQKKLV